jgi:hypothetical protein
MGGLLCRQAHHQHCPPLSKLNFSKQEMGAMSFADDDEFAAFISNESALLHMTNKSIEEALEGFPLVLTGGRDTAWLCMATRRALAISLPNYKESPDRTSNADIVGELNRLAEVSQ